MAQFDLLVTGGQVHRPEGGLEGADVGILDGRIAAIGDLSSAEATERLDATGLAVLPGVIDTQVHFREPGMEHKVDLETGTRSAALGGVTSLFEMPNTVPATITAEALAWKVERAAGRVWTDVAFYMGGVPANADHLADIEWVEGCCGIKVFHGSSTGKMLCADPADVARVFASGGRRISLHSEADEVLTARKHIAEEAGEPHAHPVWRNVESAVRSTRRLLELAEAAERPVHILHITTAEEMELLAAARARRGTHMVTVEVTPQHLTLAAPDCYDAMGTRAQMNPPVREARHRDALWAALESGVVDVIGSDHAPHTLEEKARPYPASPSGMPGVQTVVPIMLDHVAAGRLSLDRFVELTATTAARIWKIEGKGPIHIGRDADLTLVDLAAKRELRDDWIGSRAGWTPFAGQTVTGWPMATLVRGHVVMRDGELQGTPIGQPLRFARV